jgi:hypothetical protein
MFRSEGDARPQRWRRIAVEKGRVCAEVVQTGCSEIVIAEVGSAVLIVPPGQYILNRNASIRRTAINRVTGQIACETTELLPSRVWARMNSASKTAGFRPPLCFDGYPGQARA